MHSAHLALELLGDPDVHSVLVGVVVGAVVLAVLVGVRIYAGADDEADSTGEEE